MNLLSWQNPSFLSHFKIIKIRTRGVPMEGPNDTIRSLTSRRFVSIINFIKMTESVTDLTIFDTLRLSRTLKIW